MKAAGFLHLRISYYFVCNSFEAFHVVYLEYEWAGHLKPGELSHNHGAPGSRSLHSGPIAVCPQSFVRRFAASLPINHSLEFYKDVILGT